ncbi:MAG: hypothetical protein JWN52_5799 [Actinomycetia bacterium]|nr:hypothetical protein [Actinomycetes bacterium]
MESFGRWVLRCRLTAKRQWVTGVTGMRISGHRARTLLLTGLCAVVLACGGALPAAADGAPSGGDVHIAQTLGSRELTVVIRRVVDHHDPVAVPDRLRRGGLVANASGPPLAA